MQSQEKRAIREMSKEGRRQGKIFLGMSQHFSHTKARAPCLGHSLSLQLQGSSS